MDGAGVRAVLEVPARGITLGIGEAITRVPRGRGGVPAPVPMTSGFVRETAVSENVEGALPATGLGAAPVLGLVRGGPEEV